MLNSFKLNSLHYLLTFAPVLRSKSSQEPGFHGAKVPHLELSLPGANGLGSEKSSYQTLRWL